MTGRHLKPINRRGHASKRRMLKSLPSLSCDWPSFEYVHAPEKTIDATIGKKQKEKIAA